MSEAIYFDHSATTPLDPEVRAAMLPYLDGHFGNPSSLHRAGRAARAAVDTAREQVAALIGADRDEIFFTGSGTEANNLALRGLRIVDGRRKVVLSAVEHDAVRHCATARRDTTPVSCPVGASGRLDLTALETLLGADTLLASVMLVNNETGTLQNFREIAEGCAAQGVHFHCDAIQAAGLHPINVREVPVDLLSLSAHKLYGPKGVGALYVRRGLRIDPLLRGGPQERGRRGGTENVAGIVGFGVACALAAARRATDAREIAALRDLLDAELRAAVPGAVRNGDTRECSPHILNIRFPGADGESLLLGLDAQGIAVSTGSACTAGSLEPSHVLLAMGLSHTEAQSALRFSLGRNNTAAEVRRVVAVLAGLL